MTAFAAPIITGSTLLKLVVGALVAGIGVMLAFSLLVYTADRATELRQLNRRGSALLFQLGAGLALLAVAAIVAYGLILTVSKPK
jgi:hypothetical protein